MSAMELLPDDVLVVVLQYVDVPDLLRCRLVCKRLQALVRDGRVWRHREVRLYGASPCDRGPLLLLSLAPCLDHLYLCAAADTLQALTRTKCAVASLTLYDGHLRFNSPLYAQVVGHQEALGRLRRVHLIFWHLIPGDDDSVLLGALTTCSRLKSLTCSYCRMILSKVDFSRPPTALFVNPVAPSLRKFSWHLNCETARFVHAVLAGHSATLEDVELWVGYGGTSGTYDTVAAVLGGLPKLHSLRLNDISLPGLPAVAACGTLRKLCVDFFDADPAFLELLRRAKQLRDVRLGWSELECEMLEALASPGLERLELVLCGRGSTEAQPLLRALPALPALRHLVLDGDCIDLLTRDLLLGITPATAPALRILELKMKGFPCAHSWVHKDEVNTALITNPSLNIQLGFRCALNCRDESCVECAMGCHKDIWKAGMGICDILKVSIHLHELQITVSSRVLSYLEA